MDGINENLIQQFSKKLEEMSFLRINFKQFGFCYAAYSGFRPVTSENESATSI